MPTLYVANATKQFFKFHYRAVDVKEDVREDENGTPVVLRKVQNSSLRVQDIRPGGQIRVSGNLSLDEINHIVAQYHPYGMKPVSEIHGSGFTGLCYDVDKEVKLDNILFALEQNDSVMDEEARKQRELSAASIAQDMAEKMGELGVDVPRVELVIAEDDGNGAPPKNAEVFEVAQGQATQRGRRRTRAG